MRSDKQILQAAIGDDQLNRFERLQAREVGRFRVYRIHLPQPRYRGLPPVWHFAVASRPEQRIELRKVEEEARELIDKNLDGRTPLVLVCEDPAVRLSDRFLLDGESVFFIDEPMLPKGRELPRHPRSAAFVRAVRNRLDAQDLATMLFEPYQTDRPVTGWRFFGRRRELERLLYSEENVFVAGARKIGKTSLLNETKERLIERGEAVYAPVVQHLNSAERVVEAILQSLSARDASAAVRRSRALNEELLSTVLRRLSSQHGRVTLILDELGNVIFNTRKMDWRVFGILREFSQSGRLRVIMSGFQEFFIKQADDFSGPFVNFAGVMRLGGFDDPEIEELLIDPLKLWGRVDDGAALLRLVTSEVGRHPYILGYLGQAVFRRMFENPDQEAQSIVRSLLRGSGLEVFFPPVEVLFLDIESAAARYVFLRRCHEAARARTSLHQAELTDEWVEDALSSIGCPSTQSGRRLLLDEFQMRGLTSPVNITGSRQRIAVPIIYSVMTASEDVDRYLASLAKDISYEKGRLLRGAASD